MMFSFMESVFAIKSAIYVFLRCFLKGFLRRTTNLCELQRICYADNIGSRRTKGVGMRSLNAFKVVNLLILLIADRKVTAAVAKLSAPAN